ncbi:hypothetical protein ACIQVK_53745 [Streptomyces sp. NPDC090493]|uniref:hypothetical protein n=1 Tax=Streptomyces sp. NPDC090493 TaxID=3365964 RepID=UPI00381E6547
MDGEAWAYRFAEPAGTVREPDQDQGANTGGLWEASALSLGHPMPWRRATSRPISRFEALAESAELPLDEVMQRAGFHMWHAGWERYRADVFDDVRHVLSLPSWEQPSERHLRVFAAEVTALRTQNQFASIVDVRKARFEDLKLALLADDTRVSIGRRYVVAAGRNWMGPNAGSALSVFDLENVDHNGIRWPAEWAARDTYLLATRNDPQGRMVYAFDGQGRGHYVSFGEVASLLAVDTELQSRGQVTDVLFVGGFLGLLVRELRSIADAVGRAVIAYPEGLRLQGSSQYGLRVVTQGVRNPYQWERVRPQRRPLIVPGVDGGPTVWAFRPDGEHTADYMARSSYLEVLRRSAGYLTRSYDTGEFNWQPWPVLRGRERLYIIDAVSGGPDYVSNTNGGRWISAEEFADAVQYAVEMEVPKGIIPVFVLDFQVIGATPDGWDPLLNVSIPQALANRLGTAVHVPVGMTEWGRGATDQHLVLVRQTGDTSAGLRVFVPEISESPSVKTQISSLSELGVRQAVRLVKEFVNNEDGRARELWTEAAFELFRKLRESRNYSAGVPYPFSLREVVEFAHENPEPALRSSELRQVFGELLELTKNGGLRAGAVPVSREPTSEMLGRLLWQAGYPGGSEDEQQRLKGDVRLVLSLAGEEEISERHLQVFASEVISFHAQRPGEAQHPGELVSAVWEARLRRLWGVLLANDTRVSIERGRVVGVGRNWLRPDDRGSLPALDLENVVHDGVRVRAALGAEDSYFVAADYDPVGRMVYAFDGQGNGHYVSFGEVASLLSLDAELENRADIKKIRLLFGAKGSVVPGLQVIANLVLREVMVYPATLELKRFPGDRGSDDFMVSMVSRGGTDPYRWDQYQPQYQPEPQYLPERPEYVPDPEYQPESEYLPESQYQPQYQPLILPNPEGHEGSLSGGPSGVWGDRFGLTAPQRRVLETIRNSLLSKEGTLPTLAQIAMTSGIKRYSLLQEVTVLQFNGFLDSGMMLTRGSLAAIVPLAEAAGEPVGSGLSDLQRQVLKVTWNLLLRPHRPPTIEEIRKDAGIGTWQGVEYHLMELEFRKLVSREEGTRGLDLTEGGQWVIAQLTDTEGGPTAS